VGAQWIGRWRGGRIRQTSDGRRVWVIEKRVRRAAGIPGRVAIPLSVSDEAAAKAELKLFLRNPSTYALTARRPRLAPAPVVALPRVVKAPALFTPENLESWAKDLLARDRDPHYVRSSSLYLAAWAEVLGPALKGVELAQLKAALRGWKGGQKFRIIALKSFTKWARGEDLLKRADDPTLDLKVPASVAGKELGQRAYRKELLEKTYAVIPTQAVRDTVRLALLTGMHLTEVARVASRKGVLADVTVPGEIRGTVSFRHKNGRVHRVSLNASTYDAAKRLQARGRGLDPTTVHNGLRQAARALGTEALHPGRFRHTFSNLAESEGELVKLKPGGVAKSDVLAVLAHSEATNRKHYHDLIPPMIRLPLRLEHPEDPAPLAAPERRTTRARRG